MQPTHKALSCIKYMIFTTGSDEEIFQGLSRRSILSLNNHCLGPLFRKFLNLHDAIMLGFKVGAGKDRSK